MCEKVKGCNSRIDKCMKDLISKINENTKFTSVACCCWHRKYPMTIVCDFWGKKTEILSGIEIPRKRRFYQKDEEGIYYIPEVSK